MPKRRDGQVEAIRALMVAKRAAGSERVQTSNQTRSVIVTGPDGLRVPVRQAAWVSHPRLSTALICSSPMAGFLGPVPPATVGHRCDDRPPAGSSDGVRCGVENPCRSRTIAERPLLCDLIAQMSAVLERTAGTVQAF